MFLDQIQAVYIHCNEVTYLVIYHGQPQSKALRRSKKTVVDSWCVKDNFLNEYVLITVSEYSFFMCFIELYKFIRKWVL